MSVGVQDVPLLKLGLLPTSPATLLSGLGSAWKVGTLSIVLVEAYAGATSVTGGKGPSSLWWAGDPARGEQGLPLPASGQLLIPQILFAIKTL